MYAEHFGLKREPFSIAPDPRYLFMSEHHREALAHLLYGVRGGGGFVLLTGEIGAGKTTVCRCFLEQVPKRVNVAYIFNPKLTAIELLRSVCEEFHIPVDRARTIGATVKDFLDPLNAFLLQAHAAGQNNVLIIDEAQNLSADVLEQLRLLTNLETNERKLLQIILIGQPELREMLARPELEQLAQRVTARFHLEPLDANETAHYIKHRLAVAGMSGLIPFDRDARRRIHEITRGIPRRINLLCDRALLGAYATGRDRVDTQIVDKAAHEVFDRREPTLAERAGDRRVWLIGGGGAVALLVAGAAGYWLAAGGGGRSAPGATPSAAPAPTAAASRSPLAASAVAASPSSAAASSAGPAAGTAAASAARPPSSAAAAAAAPSPTPASSGPPGALRAPAAAARGGVAARAASAARP